MAHNTAQLSGLTHSHFSLTAGGKRNNRNWLWNGTAGREFLVLLLSWFRLFSIETLWFRSPFDMTSCINRGRIALYIHHIVYWQCGVTQPLEELRLGTLPYYYHNIQAFHPTLFFLQESSFFSSLLFCLHYCVEIFFTVPWLLAAIITLLFIRFTSQDPRSTIFYTFF